MNQKECILGVDIDGVITNCESFWREYGSQYLINNNKRFNYISCYDLAKSYGFKTELNYDKTGYMEFMKYLYPLYANICKPRYLVKEVLDKLHSEGYKIIIITGRHLSSQFHNKTIDQGKKEVQEFLDSYDIYYDEIVYSDGNKVEECVSLNIPVFLEDNPEILEALRVDGRVIPLCFDNEYNHTYTKVERIYSWYHFYQYVHDFFKG